MKVLGIDPGINGAIALLGGGAILVDNLPTMGEGKRRVVNATQLTAMIEEVEPTVAILEKVHAMPAQGVSSSFRFGQAFGTIEGIIGALRVPLHYVSPVAWKKHFRLPADKDAARAMATKLYPLLADRLSRKKDIDRAEALLIARYFMDTTGETFGTETAI